VCYLVTYTKERVRIVDAREYLDLKGRKYERSGESYTVRGIR
jgi:CYTH domain-containing protein